MLLLLDIYIFVVKNCNPNIPDNPVDQANLSQITSISSELLCQTV